MLCYYYYFFLMFITTLAMKSLAPGRYAIIFLPSRDINNE